MFFSIELLGFVWSLINLLTILRFKERKPPPAPAGLSVDVLIPTYNEPVALVRRTLIAAQRISYAHEVWLLDDGKRQEMRDLATELGCRYMTRDDNKGAKAGNLNNTLKYSKAEFVLVFDADFIAVPDFLDRTLGYFNDPKVAFVQTPQEFYNFDSYQHMGQNREHDSWSEHSLFYYAIQRGRDSCNAAMMCGSAAILRRSALDDVGGFIDSTVTEDMHTSLRMHSKGWTSVFHPETLSAGLAPHDARSFQRQRKRWAQGAMQIAKQEGLLLLNLDLTLLQRLAYISHIGNYIDGLRYAFIFCVSAVAIIFSIFPISSHFGVWAIFTLPYLIFCIFCFEELSRGYGHVIRNETYNLARCPAYIRALPALFTRKEIRFRVTPKTRQRAAPFIFPWFILFLNLFALIKAGFDAWYGFGTLSGWPLTMVSLWCCLSIWTAWNVCWLTDRCNDNRREFSRFPVDIPVTLMATDGPVRAVITDLSDTGLTVAPLHSNTALPTGNCHGTLTLAGKTVDFNVMLRPTENGKSTGGCLSWDSNAERDNYEYLMIVDRIRLLEKFKRSDYTTHLAPVARLIQDLKPQRLIPGS